MTGSPIVSDNQQKTPQEPEGSVRKPVFLDQVVARSGLKKRDAKTAVDAALAVLADALAKGDELVLPPLGKLRVVKAKEIGGGASVLTLKLRTTKDGAGAGKSGLAEADDAD